MPVDDTARIADEAELMVDALEGFVTCGGAASSAQHLADMPKLALAADQHRVAQILTTRQAISIPIVGCFQLRGAYMAVDDSDIVPQLVGALDVHPANEVIERLACLAYNPSCRVREGFAGLNPRSRAALGDALVALIRDAGWASVSVAAVAITANVPQSVEILDCIVRDRWTTDPVWSSILFMLRGGDPPRAGGVPFRLPADWSTVDAEAPPLAEELRTWGRASGRAADRARR
jgi:hypothetical protein